MVVLSKNIGVALLFPRLLFFLGSGCYVTSSKDREFVVHRIGMVSVKYLFKSSVGKKQLVGLTGLAISAFVVSHVAGNLLLLVGPEAYNRYSHALVTNPLIYVAEIGLLLAFMMHVGLTINLAISNAKARGPKPIRPPNGSKRTSWAVRTMILSGLMLLAFLILHLITFKYGTYYETQYGGVVMRDLYRLALEKFKSPLYTTWYIVCLCILGLHLSHGLASTFQSLGLASVRTPLLRKIGWALAILISVGFIVQPLYLMFCVGVAT